MYVRMCECACYRCNRAFLYSTEPIVSFPDPERTLTKNESGDNMTCCLTFEERDQDDVLVNSRKLHSLRKFEDAQKSGE